MTTFNRKDARLLLEICRYTYAAGFESASNAKDKEDAFQAINQAGVSGVPVVLRDDRGSRG